MSYVIEMLWACGACGQRDLRGLDPVCPRCHHHKDADDHEYMPGDTSEAAAITDEAKLAVAAQGPDWVCPTCQTRVAAGVEACPECADRRRAEAARVGAAGTAGAKGGVAGHARTYAVDGMGDAWPLDVRDERECFGGDAPVLSRRARLRLALIVCAIAALLALALYFIFRTRIVEAHVTAMRWEHAVVIDRYQVLSHEGWTPASDAFDVRNLGRRVHHHDRVLVGSHQEPYTDRYACGQDCRTTPERCHSNGNGTATCTGGGTSCSTRYCTRTAYQTVNDYESVPRYQDWFAWHAWGWKYDRTVKHAGRSQKTSWPEGPELEPAGGVAGLASGERERARREASYRVTFSDGEDTHEFKPTSEGAFTRFGIGQAHRLKVGLAHGVEVLSATAEARAALSPKAESDVAPYRKDANN